MSMRARWGVSLSVLLVWLLVPAFQALPAWGTGEHGACADGLCRCRHDPQPSRPATPSCHDDSAAPRPCEMSSRCHDREAAVVAAALVDGILSPAQARPGLVLVSAAPEAAAGSPTAGHARFDPPPPRPSRPA